MVKVGTFKVIFSQSFLMGKHRFESASFPLPGHPGATFFLQVADAPSDAQHLSSSDWSDFTAVDGGTMMSFELLPEGKTAYDSTTVGSPSGSRVVQIVRQGISENNRLMMVHIIVMEEEGKT